MVQIGSDSGLMPRPVRRREILIGPAERVEVIVDFAGSAGETVELRSGPHGGRSPGRLARLRRRADAVPRRARPGRRPHPGPAPPAAAAGWAEQAKERRTAIPTRPGRSRSAGCSRPTWTINGRTFNPARADAFPVLGTTEVWEFHQPHRGSPT